MTRINAISSHQINDHDTEDSYRVELLHLRNGNKVGYRVGVGENLAAYVPVETDVADALADLPSPA